jgi:hypothetical protein
MSIGERMAAKPPVEESGKTFFVADAEDGGVVKNRTPVGPWGWQVADYSTGSPLVTNSTTRAKNGTRSYKFEIANPLAFGSHSTQVLSGGPQVSMGSPNGRYLAGYYSWYVYVESGFGQNDWNMMLGWMTGVSGAPQPIFYMGLRAVGGVRQLHIVNQKSANGHGTSPNIAGYLNANNGYYFMTASSPAGVVPFPTGRWVHIVAHNNFQATNGRLRLWQDGVLIMDLTHPDLDLRNGTTGTNTAGDMLIQFGIYQGQTQEYASLAPYRFYVDDFKVTDYRVQP